jgi:hypothetical protein
MTTLSPAAVSTTRHDPRIPPLAGVVRGAPGLVLRLEAAAVLGVSLAAYARTGESWPMFALLFLTPDLSMLGYLAGRRVGAAAYNAAHSYLIPVALGAVAVTLSTPHLLGVALIWVAHIGFDRLLGYGLKYGSAFTDTHLSAKR